VSVGNLAAMEQLPRHLVVRPVLDRWWLRPATTWCRTEAYAGWTNRRQHSGTMHPSSPPPLLLLSAAASAAAGIVHAAAAGSHAELTTLATLFGIVAVLQIGWAALAVTRRGAAVVLAGAALQVGALGAWVASRTVGISFVDGLADRQDIAFQDGLVVTLELLAVGAGLASLTSLRLGRLTSRFVPAMAAVMVAAAVPAMATPHDHASHDDHGTELAHDDAHSQDPEHGHDVDDGHPHDDAVDHHDARVVEADPDVPYPASFVSWLDQAPTPDARARAEQLLLDTTEAMKAYPDEAAVQAAGFISIGDGVTGWEHYIHVDRILDPAVLDPAGIESIVLRVAPDGTKEVASAMYLMPFGTTMADVPDIAGDLTTWHDHQNLCWDGATVVGTTDATGACARGEFRPTQPMLHVWVTEHECGPFAGIEGSHGSGCGHADHE
jgi:hypothetical protein